MNRDMDAAERLKYEKMWGLQEYRISSPDAAFVAGAFKDLIEPGASVNIYGCGPGRAGLFLTAAGHKVSMCDIADNCLDPAVKTEVILGRIGFVRSNIKHIAGWMKPADWGLCCDVMEHLPEEWIFTVLAQIRLLTPRTFFSIGTNPDTFGERIGETLHLTVRLASWWANVFADVWGREFNVPKDHGGQIIIVTGG